MNDFEMMLERLAEKAAKLDDDQVEKTKAAIEEIHRALLLRQMTSTNAFEASLNSALSTFAEDIQSLLIRRSNAMNLHHKKWADMAGKMADEVEDQISAYQDLMQKNDIKRLRERIDPRVQKEIESKMDNQSSEIRVWLDMQAEAMRGWMLAGLMVFVFATGGLCFAMPNSVDPEQVDQVALQRELNIANIRTERLHGYLMMLYPKLKEFRQSEIDALNSELGMIPSR